MRSHAMRRLLLLLAYKSTGKWFFHLSIWIYIPQQQEDTVGSVAIFMAAYQTGVLCGLASGVFIDWFGPRRVLIAAQFVAVAAFCTLPFLLSTGLLSMSLCVLVYGTAHAHTLPAVQALVPRLIPPQEQLRANANVNAVISIATIFGPLLAASSESLFGLTPCLWIGGLCTLGAGLQACRLPAPSPAKKHTFNRGLPEKTGQDKTSDTKNDTESDTKAGKETAGRIATVTPRIHNQTRSTTKRKSEHALFFIALKEGMLLIWRTPALRHLFWISNCTFIFWGAYLVIEPVYVEEVLKESPFVFSLMQVAFGAGRCGGDLFLGRVQPSTFTGLRVVGGMAAISGGCAMLYTGTSITGIALAGSVLWGITTALHYTPKITALQQESPQPFHGRVFACNTALNACTQIATIPAFTLLIKTIGVQETAFLVTGFVIISCSAPLWLSPFRRGEGDKRGGGSATVAAASSITSTTTATTPTDSRLQESPAQDRQQADTVRHGRSQS